MPRLLMLHFLDGVHRLCDKLPRRSFLTAGSLAVGGLTLPGLLRAANASASRAKSVIMVYLPGGPPHQDMFDPKPDAPAEIRGEFKPIATALTGGHLSELMPMAAERLGKFALIRSIVGSDGAHASTQCLTGWPYQNPPPGGHPHFGATAAALLGVPPGLPATADLSMKMAHLPYNIPGAGYLRPALAPFRPDPAVVASMTLAAERQGVFSDRKKLLTAFDDLRRVTDASPAMAAWDDAVRESLSLLTSSRVVAALDVAKEPESLRDRYGKDDPKILPYSDLGYQAIVSKFLVARRLVEAGVRVVSLSFADFDWHGKNFEHARKVCPVYDRAITALVDDLGDRGMLDNTLVVAWGEFGRTPKVNDKAGRDHWPAVNTALLAGGGLKVGQVIVGTDRLAERVTLRPVHVQEVLATVYHHLGIDAAGAIVPDVVSARPQPVLNDYRPIAELVG